MNIMYFLYNIFRSIFIFSQLRWIVCVFFTAVIVFSPCFCETLFFLSFTLHYFPTLKKNLEKRSAVRQIVIERNVQK